MKNDPRVQGQTQTHAESFRTRWEASSQKPHDTCPPSTTVFHASKRVPHTDAPQYLCIL